MKLLAILLLAFGLRFFITYNHFQDPLFQIQQDHYLNYAAGNIDFADSRLFPGYPLLLRLFGSSLEVGLILNIVVSLGSIVIFNLITKNLLATLVFAFFPPVWVMAGTKIASEPLTVFLLLLSLFFFLRKKYFLAGMFCGIGATVRLISVCLVLAYMAVERKNIRKILLGFIPAVGLLLVYNYWAFGTTGLFQQFTTYPKIAGVGGFSTFGLITIFQDLVRTLDWHQYRIFISGMFYLGLNLVALTFLFKKKSVYFYWQLFSLLFIFSLSPIPLLEEFGRFTVPYVPAIIIGLSQLKHDFI